MVELRRIHRLARHVGKRAQSKSLEFAFPQRVIREQLDSVEAGQRLRQDGNCGEVIFPVIEARNDRAL